MKSITNFAVLCAALVAAVPFASSSTLIYGDLNTVGNSSYGYPPNMFTVSSSGAAMLDLVTPGVPAGTTTGIVTGPPASGTLAYFYPAATVTDFSFSTASISSSTPTEILSVANGSNSVQFFATSTGAFTPTNIPTTEGTLVLYGYLSTTGAAFSPNGQVELDIAANGIGNNFTEDLIAPAPEPSSLLLLGSGAVSAGGLLIRRRRVA